MATAGAAAPATAPTSAPSASVASSTAESVSVRPATSADVASLFEIIQDSYDVELGDSPVAFKLPGHRRYADDAQLRAAIAAGRVLAAEDKASGAVLGGIVYELTPAEKKIGFGPFAVARGLQGRGVGKALLAGLNGVAAAHGCTTVEIHVVNHRVDVLPMYRKIGFVEVGTDSYPRPEELSKPSHFLVMHCPAPLPVA